jgi:hypothetical protein
MGETKTPVHYHVTRHSDDDEPFATTDLYTALSYAADEIDNLAEFEHESISIFGDMGSYKEAYKAFQRTEELSVLRANAAHPVEQHSVPRTDRAPLYQGDDSDALLWDLAQRMAEKVSDESPVTISECRESTDDPDAWCWTATHNEDGQLLDG